MSPIQFNPRLKERDWGGWRNARVSVVLVLILLCTACGFQLRKDLDLPPEMARTRMVIDDEYSLLARRVRSLLEQSGTRFVASDVATAFLEIPTNKVDIAVLTIGDNANVREYRVSHTVKFRVTDASGRELIRWQTIRQARELSFDAQNILAISREQEYLKQDLAQTLARMLVTRLGS